MAWALVYWKEIRCRAFIGYKTLDFSVQVFQDQQHFTTDVQVSKKGEKQPIMPYYIKGLFYVKKAGKTLACYYVQACGLQTSWLLIRPQDSQQTF